MFKRGNALWFLLSISIARTPRPVTMVNGVGNRHTRNMVVAQNIRLHKVCGGESMSGVLLLECDIGTFPASRVCRDIDRPCRSGTDVVSKAADLTMRFRASVEVLKPKQTHFSHRYSSAHGARNRPEISVQYPLLSWPSLIRYQTWNLSSKP